MTTKVGVIGCGNISPSYLKNASAFADIEIVAVADLDQELALNRAKQFGVRNLTVEEMLQNDDIEIILNLTPPMAHAAVTRSAMAAGKHVYSEKPLAITFKEGLALKAEAEKLGVQVCVAPDTFLGASHQLARQLIDGGEIGRILGGVSFFLSPGMESWHPNPGFFYKQGGGPLFDMAPYYITLLVNLLGPVERVAAMSSLPWTSRTVTAAGPMNGKDIAVEIPTTFWSVLAFKSGAQISMGVSWDVAMHSLPHIELYGAQGSIRLADPDQFGGSIYVGKAGEWKALTTESMRFGSEGDEWVDHRILGLVDMVMALRENREPRTSIGRALHVLETIDALTQASEVGGHITLSTTCKRPEPLDSSNVRLR